MFLSVGRLEISSGRKRIFQLRFGRFGDLWRSRFNVLLLKSGFMLLDLDFGKGILQFFLFRPLHLVANHLLFFPFVCFFLNFILIDVAVFYNYFICFIRDIHILHNFFGLFFQRLHLGRPFRHDSDVLFALKVL